MLIKEKYFKILRIDNAIRISKKSFNEWPDSLETYFDQVMERAIKKARFLVEDLKYIQDLHKDERDEVAYGFTLATIESAEDFALQVRQLAISQKIPDSEPEIQRMVDAVYKVELGFTKDGYFVCVFPDSFREWTGDLCRI